MRGSVVEATAIENRIEKLSDNVGKIENTQAFQTDAIGRLASLATSSNEVRRDVDKQAEQIIDIRRRLDRIESK